MSKQKKEVRKAFRDGTFRRDKYTCVMCGFRAKPADAETFLDAHHITPREDMPHGGYVKENGVTLCTGHHLGDDAGGCHARAEDALKRKAEGLSFEETWGPDALYLKVGSSKIQAVQAANRLK